MLSSLLQRIACDDSIEGIEGPREVFVCTCALLQGEARQYKLFPLRQRTNTILDDPKDSPPLWVGSLRLQI